MPPQFLLPRIVLASLLFALDAISHGAPTAGVDAPPKSIEADQAPGTSPVIAAGDSYALESRVGSDVIVEGLVKTIGNTASASMTFLNFTESKSGFVAVIFRSSYDKFPEGFDKYIDQTVRVRGKINKYRDRQLQIVISSPDQLALVQDTAETISNVTNPVLPAHSHSNDKTVITINEMPDEVEAVVKDNGMGECTGEKTTKEFVPDIKLSKDIEGKKTKVKFYAVLENKNESGITIQNFPEGINIKELKSSQAAPDSASSSPTFKYTQSDWSCSCCKNVKVGILKGYYAEVISDGKVLASTSSDLTGAYKEELDRHLGNRSHN